MIELSKIAQRKSDHLKQTHKYEMVFWSKFDYGVLKNIMYYKKKGKNQKGTWNDIIVMADTETSKSHDRKFLDEFGNPDPSPNHVVAWTISMRAYHMNIVTLYGTRPSDMMACMRKIKKALQGDELYIYFHNMSYDYVFLRLFLFKEFGEPEKALNTKPHYPISIRFSNGIILKDSLILAGCKLEKWAKDLNVDHKKAVGSWDYDKVRDQSGNFSEEELHYIENDTLAGVECLDALCLSLKKTIYSVPFTATGIPRAEVRARGKENRAHDRFLNMALTYEQFIKFRKLYHGGYTHGNRFYIDDLLDSEIVRCFDFNSSYPYCLLAFKYPMTKFIPFKQGQKVKPETILKNSEKYAFIFRITFINIKLKEYYSPMPALQSTKCEQSINMVTDNGRVESAGYCTLYMCEQDLHVIREMYTWDEDATYCTEVEMSIKDYLPRWFTDYVFEMYRAKCEYKPKKKEDPVAYALSKARVNSLYGLTVQASIRDEYVEVIEPGYYKCNADGDEEYYESGEYRIDYDKDPRKEYEKYLKNQNNVLNYQIGTYCTAYAFRNLFELGHCVKEYRNDNGELLYPPHWYYSDTDSCYSDDWDYEKIMRYNQGCKEKLKANGYGAVIVGDEEYWLGVASHDPHEDAYEEFKVLGSKRYAGRSLEDHEIHITVAGVPKKGAICLKDDLNNFTKDFIFDGKVTGKLTHYYIYSKEGIYIDDYGNEVGDSIDLQPCSYVLDMVTKVNFLEDEVVMPYYGEENIDIYDL